MMRILRRLTAVLGVIALLALVGLAAPSAARADDPVPGSPEALLGDALGLSGSCDGPVPSIPWRGATGAVLAPNPDQAPAAADPFAPGAKTTIYQQYGLSWSKWHTCDLNGPLSPDEADPGMAFTGIANLGLLFPQFFVGVFAAMSEYAYHPLKWFSVARPAVEQVIGAIYDGVTQPLSALALVVLAIVLAIRSARASFSKALTLAVTAVVIIAALGALVTQPWKWVQFGAEAGPQVVAGVSNELSAGPGQAVDPADAAAGNVVDAILYQRWLAGMFGDTTSPVVEKYGPTLFKASAMSWAEAREVQDNPRDAAEKVKEKQAAYSEAMGRIKTEDPNAYEYATGRDWNNRIGQAFVANFATLCILPFQVVSQFLLIAAPFVMVIALFVFVLLGPLGLVGGATTRFVLGPAVMAGTALLNAILFGAATFLHLFLINAFLDPRNGIPAFFGLILVGVMSLVMWLALRPYRTLVSMVGFHGQRAAKKSSRLAGVAAGAAKAYLTGAVAGAAAGKAAQTAPAPTAVPPPTGPPAVGPGPRAAGLPSGSHIPTATVDPDPSGTAPIPDVDGEAWDHVPGRPALDSHYTGRVFDPSRPAVTADAERPAVASPAAPTRTVEPTTQEGQVIYRVFTPSEGVHLVDAAQLTGGTDEEGRP